MRFLPRTRGGMLWRAALAAVLVIGFAAATTTVAGLLQVKSVVADLNLSKALSDSALTLPAPGKPETLLLVGSDARYGQGDVESNTDTMMLVRIDDSSSTINLLSIPRDLDVDINGTQQKLNAAWSEGGEGLLIQTLKQQVFPGTNFYVTHVINVTFTAFSDLVDAIGCVYTMVDHRYYNYNNGDGATDYSNIDIQPGYQKLCGDVNSADGTGALAFVRFRHTDSDLVREMRQQDFLRWAKSQFSQSELEDNEAKLLKIFGRDTQSDGDLHNTNALLELFDLAIDADGHETKDITFQPGPNVEIGSGQNAEDALGNDVAQNVAEYEEFMTPTVAPSATSTTTSSSSTSSTTSTSTSTTKPKPAKVQLGGLIADPGDGESQSGLLHETPALPVYYPKYIVDGSQYCFTIAIADSPCYDDAEPESAYAGSYPRSYTITSRGDKTYPAYAMTLELNPNLGEYYTVEGTTWKYPPILTDPAEVVHLNGKTLDVYVNSGATTGDVNLVAWHTAKAVYWISNTLDDAISNRQMIAMAAEFAAAK